jgi:hypothetical protein
VDPQRIKCACFCVLKDAEIRTTKAGQDYLSIIAVSGKDSYRTWITLYGSAVEAIIGQLRPEGKIYVEGWLSLPRDKGGERFPRIDAEIVQPIGEINLRKRPAPKKAKEPAPIPPPNGRGEILADGRAEQNGGAKKYDRPFDDDISDILPA